MAPTRHTGPPQRGKWNVIMRGCAVTVVTCGPGAFHAKVAEEVGEGFMQPDAPVQLTPVPPKPTCNANNIFNGQMCADSIRAYNQALAQRQQEEMQLYVNRQKQQASAQATAPLQQQIASLNKLTADQQAQIKTLQ